MKREGNKSNVVRIIIEDYRYEVDKSYDFSGR